MLIIYAHPNTEGHCGQFLENVEQILREKKIDYELINLYESDFHAVLKPEEHYTSGHKQVAPEVKLIQEKIKKSDKIIFIYPTWWQNMPSILKGFLDRVFIPGFGFFYEGKFPRGLLKGKNALIFTSTGAPRWITRLLYGDRSVKVLKKDLLAFCGIKSRGHVIDNAKKFTESQKNRIEKMVERAMKQFLTLSLLFCFVLSSAFLFSSSIDWKAIHEQEYLMDYEEKQGIRTQNPVSLESAYLCAIAALSIRNEEYARDCFQYISSLLPDFIPARWGMAEIARRDYRFDESKKILDDIISEKPEFIPARLSRAYIYFTDGLYEEAIELASTVLEKYSDYTDRGNLIRAHLMIGGAEGMIAEESYLFRRVARGINVLRHFRTARDLNPEDSGVLFAWGSYYLIAPLTAGGSRSKAEEMLLRALEKDPDFADIHVRLAQLYRKEKNAEKFDHHIQKARQLDSRNALLREVLKESR